MDLKIRPPKGDLLQNPSKFPHQVCGMYQGRAPGAARMRGTGNLHRESRTGEVLWTREQGTVGLKVEYLQHGPLGT